MRIQLYEPWVNCSRSEFIVLYGSNLWTNLAFRNTKHISYMNMLHNTDEIKMGFTIFRIRFENKNFKIYERTRTIASIVNLF